LEIGHDNLHAEEYLLPTGVAMFFRKKCMIICLLIGILNFNCSDKKNDMIPKVPGWAKKAIWYQIFPERFRNGDPGNDPQLADIISARSVGDSSAFQVVPWTIDWYQLQPWEQNGKGFYYHAQRRRFGGDLQGVLDKLDYLQELGVNALYFNPLFESPSLHKYDGSSYHHIDDNFGPDPDGDKKIMAAEIFAEPSTWQWTAADKLFLQLLEECHKRDFRVLIDGVFNHVGLNFFPFVDLEKNQQQSRFKNWFTVKSWDNPATEKNEFTYECWANVASMPEIREDENGFDSDAWLYMSAAIRRWMDPNADGNPKDGIDGWRLDVAEQVTKPSWLKFRQLVRSINPDCYLVAEVWWEQWPHKMFNAAPWLQGDMFDAVMNYRFAAATTKFFIDQKNKISVSQFDAELAQIRNDYPAEVNFVLQNLMDSHDTDRLASMIVNPDRIYGHANQVKHNENYNVSKPVSEQIDQQKLILLFQMTYLGAPMIFYGDEAGMWGASDPDERKPMLWEDLTYDDEICHPFGKSRPPDQNIFNAELFDYYKKLIHIRKKFLALSLGSFATVLLDDSNSIFGFRRVFNDEEIVVVINNSDKQCETKLTIDRGRWQDCLNLKTIEISEMPFIINIGTKEGIILVRE